MCTLFNINIRCHPHVVLCTHTTVLHFFNATIPATLFFSLSVANFWFIVFDERQRHSNLWQQLLQFSFFYSTSTSSKFRKQIQTLRIEQKIDDCAETHQREFNCQLFLFIYLFVVLFFLSLVWWRRQPPQNFGFIFSRRPTTYLRMRNSTAFFVVVVSSL